MDVCTSFHHTFPRSSSTCPIFFSCIGARHVMSVLPRPRPLPPARCGRRGHRPPKRGRVVFRAWGILLRSTPHPNPDPTAFSLAVPWVWSPAALRTPFRQLRRGCKPECIPPKPSPSFAPRRRCRKNEHRRPSCQGDSADTGRATPS